MDKRPHLAERGGRLRERDHNALLLVRDLRWEYFPDSNDKVFVTAPTPIARATLMGTALSYPPLLHGTQHRVSHVPQLERRCDRHTRR